MYHYGTKDCLRGVALFFPKGIFSFGMIQVIYMCTIQLGVEGKMGILIF